MDSCYSYWMHLLWHEVRLSGFLLCDAVHWKDFIGDRDDLSPGRTSALQKLWMNANGDDPLCSGADGFQI